MGVLDDAIREHLELKRQHGAPEDEVKQKEQEVLGAARAEPVETSAAPTPGAEDAARVVEPEPAPEVEEPPAAEQPAPPEPAPAAEEPVEPEPEYDYDAPTELVAPPNLADDEAPDVDDDAGDPDLESHPALPADDFEPATGDTPPRGFDAVEEDAPREGEGDEEDVLEETPDFLQETPEHDRLWFEQKPPRDFDFDE